MANLSSIKKIYLTSVLNILYGEVTLGKTIISNRKTTQNFENCVKTPFKPTIDILWITTDTKFCMINHSFSILLAF